MAEDMEDTFESVGSAAATASEVTSATLMVPSAAVAPAGASASSAAPSSSTPDLRVVVNIPFCPRTCTYCDFPVYDRSTSGMRAAYMDALMHELRASADCFEGHTVGSVLITGGTPTTVDPKALATFVKELRGLCSAAPDLEITVATNPGAIGVDALSQLKGAGVNRFDLGICTTHPLEFETLVRPYGQNDIHFSQMLFEFSKFRNFSFDVLYGIPGQTPRSLGETLDDGIDMVPAPVHMALYPLRVVPGTPLYRCFVEGDKRTRIQTNNRTLPSEEARRAMYQAGREHLEGKGFERYSVYHFAKPGWRSRHVELSCAGTDVLGLGLAAESYLDGILAHNTRDLQKYLDAAGNPEHILADATVLDDRSRQARWLVSGLTAAEGFSAKTFEERFGVTFESAFGAQAERLAAEGLLEFGGATESDRASGADRVRLTNDGCARADQVFAELQGIEPAQV